MKISARMIRFNNRFETVLGIFLPTFGEIVSDFWQESGNIVKIFLFELNYKSSIVDTTRQVHL